MTQPVVSENIPVEAIFQHMLEGCQVASSDSSFQQLLQHLIRPPDPTALWTGLSYWSGITAGGHQAAQMVVTAALTLARQASTILDDVQDGDGSVQPQLLEPRQAMNVAVALAFAAEVVLERLRDTGVPADLALRAQADYARIVMKMCSGQYDEIARQNRFDLETYQAIVEAKTASFCSLECRMSVLVTGRSNELIDQFSAFGRQIGFMYQVANDFAGLHGLHGKRTDLGYQWTWPSLYACTVAQPREREAFFAAWRNKDVEQVRHFILNSGASHYLLLLSSHHYSKAQEALERIEESVADVTQLRHLLERFRFDNANISKPLGAVTG